MLFQDVYVPWVDRNSAISADGERFLMIKPVTPTDEQSSSIQLILVQNWFEELRRLVPTN